MDEFHRCQTKHMEMLRLEIGALQKHRIDRKRKKTRRKCKQMVKKGSSPCQSGRRRAPPQAIQRVLIISSALPTPVTLARPPPAPNLGPSSSHTISAEPPPGDVSPLADWPSSGRGTGSPPAAGPASWPKPPHQSPRKSAPPPDEDGTPFQPSPAKRPFKFIGTIGGDECLMRDHRTASINSDRTIQSSSGEEDSDAISSRQLRKRLPVNLSVEQRTIIGMHELDTLSQKTAELARIPYKEDHSLDEYSPSESGTPRKLVGNRKRSRKTKSPRHDAVKPPPITATRLSVEQRMGGKQYTLDRLWSSKRAL